MKKVLLTIGLILILTVSCFAADGDVPMVEVRENVATWAIDTFKILRFTETAIVTYRKVDAIGDSLGEEFDVTFMNVVDNPDTPEDETSTEFTDFYNYITTRIRANDSIKTAITKAVKVKLGI